MEPLFYNYSEQIVSLTFEYLANLHAANLSITLNSSLLNSTTLIKYELLLDSGLASFVLLPFNNQAASYLSPSECSLLEYEGEIVKWVGVASYIVLLLSLLPAKIIGL